MRPWLSRYDDGVPASLEPYPALTLLDVLSDWARQAPDDAVASFEGTATTVRRLERASNALAAALEEQGVRRGDRVALVLPNVPQFLVAQYGAWKAGAVVVPVDGRLPPDEIAARIAHTGATVAVVLAPYYHAVKALQPRTALRHVIATGMRDALSGVRRLRFSLLRERSTGNRIVLDRGDQWLDAVLEAHLDAMRPDTRVMPDDSATLLPTAGTTGPSRWVLSPHRTLVNGGLRLASWLAGATLREGAPIALPMPLAQLYGLHIVQPMALIQRRPLALLADPRDMGGLLALIARSRPVALAGAPRLYESLLAHPRVRAGRADLFSLALCFSGGAPLTSDLRERLATATAARVLEGYALTEAGGVVAAEPVRTDHVPGSAGIPLPDIELRVVDVDTGLDERPHGAVGELLLRIAGRPFGYWNDPDATERARVVDDAGRSWLRTGDLGVIDADGAVHLVDRLSDVMAIGAYRVWPREIEQTLALHPLVAEAAVAGVPDGDGGTVARAWIVPRGGASLTEDVLRAHCRAHLPPFKVPRLITLTDALPRSAAGAVLRRKLVERHREERRAGAAVRAALRGERSTGIPLADDRPRQPGAARPARDRGTPPGPAAPDAR